MNGHDFSVDISDGFKDVEVELGILGEIPTENGATFIPSVSQDGIISWTNDKGLPNPAPVNIKGVTPHIGTNGNWFIGENDTGVPATGPASPPIPGGKAGQYLRKKSDADGDIEWADSVIPVKGKDYWTPEDVAEIKSYVDDAILGGAW